MKKKKKDVRSKEVCSHGECPRKKFLTQCGKVLLITASYQIFSVGLDAVGTQPKCGKTWLDDAASQVSSFLTNPANALEGTCRLYTGCYNACIGGCTGCMGCQGYTGPSQEEIRQQQEEAERRRQEAERQRQQELEEQMRQEAAAAAKRQAEFERKKQETLQEMKGITEGELGIKGTDAGGLGLKDIGEAGTGSPGLKDAPNSASAKKTGKPECEWGNLGSSVVDLRCLGLDPNKPVTIDPHVVRGKERVFPAQIDPKTFENVNYNKGFEALMRFDSGSAAAAVQFFKKAQKERPNDPLVRNALLLAQDIFKARKQKEENDRARAADLTRKTYAALMTDEMGSARSYITRARELDPDNSAIRFLDSTLAIIGPESMTAATPEKRAAYKLVGHSLLSMAKENYSAATSMLEVARKMAPDDPFIEKFLTIVSNYKAGRASANTGKGK